VYEIFGGQAEAACVIAWCESHYNPAISGDSGNSLGLFQMWTGWAKWYGISVGELFDGPTNARVAKAVLDYRGRWGGQGGWSCAGLNGIY